MGDLCKPATRTPPGSEGGKWTGPNPQVSTTLSTVASVNYQKLTSSEGGKWTDTNSGVTTTLLRVTTVNTHLTPL